MNQHYTGSLLIRLRKERQLSTIAFAKALGIPQHHLIQLERNQKPLTATLLQRFAERLGLDVSALSGVADATLGPSTGARRSPD